MATHEELVAALGNKDNIIVRSESSVEYFLGRDYIMSGAGLVPCIRVQTKTFRNGARRRLWWISTQSLEVVA